MQVCIFGHSSLTIDDMSLLLETQLLFLRILSLAEVTHHKTESLKASLREMMMMKVQNDLKLNRKE